MAESVDALVSNTSGATHPGSIPGLGTEERNKSFSLFLFSMYTAAQGHKGGSTGQRKILRDLRMYRH